MSKRLALLVGSSEFEDRRLSKLRTPGVDVRELADVLKQPLIGAFDEVLTLDNPDCDTTRISIARLFTGRSPNDLLVLFFSGHGIRDENGDLYLAVKDTSHDLLSATAIPASFVTEEMDRSRSRRQVLILDCCHSGAFARGMKASVNAPVGTGPAFEGNGVGRVVLTASDATQFAWEGDRVVGDAESSVFSRYLVQGLRSGDADIDQDGKISVDELYDYVFEKVVAVTPRQTPGKWAYKQQGGIILARRPISKAVDILSVGGNTTPPGSENPLPLGQLMKWVACVVGAILMIVLAVDWLSPPKDTSKLVEQGKAAMEARNYAEAVRYYRSAAELGDTEGMTRLGDIYRDGLKGVSKNFNEATEWYRKAANAGSSCGMTSLGDMYRARKSYTEAISWYRKAVDAGDSTGMVLLGTMYGYGWGVTKDYGKAIEWYRKAANAGNSRGEVALGAMYHNGWGVAQNYDEAREYFLKAAEARETTAMVYLGMIHRKGLGISKDLSGALDWYRKAAEGGNLAGMTSTAEILLEGGEGVSKNQADAVTWYTKAAEAGDIDSMRKLISLSEKASERAYWGRQIQMAEFDQQMSQN